MSVVASRRPTLIAAVGFALGGIGFALGNLLLARFLPSSEYGAVALFLAFIQIGITLGPLGMSTAVNRYQLQATPAILKRVCATCGVAAFALGAVSYFAYHFHPLLVLTLVLAAFAAGLNRVGSAFFQSRQRFALSLLLMLAPNWVILCSVPVALLHQSAIPVALVISCGYFVMVVLGWRRALCGAGRSHQLSEVTASVLGREGFALIGFQLAVMLMLQLERLLIPHVLSMVDLAKYAAVSAVAGAPFRVLQLGAGYSLLPRLRACDTRERAQRLVRSESGAILLLAILAGAGVLLLTHWIMAIFVSDRYTFSYQLLSAIVVLGFAAVWSTFATVIVSACGTSRQLFLLNLSSWSALVATLILASLVGSLGLTALVCSIAAGWTLSALGATALATSVLKNRYKAK